MLSYEEMDFERNSRGILVVRVLRVRDIIKAFRCSESRAYELIREIRGETNADGSLAFILPSQLAEWTHRKAGKTLDALPSSMVTVRNSAGTTDALKRAAARLSSEPTLPVTLPRTKPKKAT